MATPMKANPSVTCQLVPQADGTVQVAINVKDTGDLVLVLNLLARGQVAVLEKMREAAQAQAERAIVTPPAGLFVPRIVGGN